MSSRDDLSRFERGSRIVPCLLGVDTLKYHFLHHGVAATALLFRALQTICYTATLKNDFKPYTRGDVYCYIYLLIFL